MGHFCSNNQHFEAAHPTTSQKCERRVLRKARSRNILQQVVDNNKSIRSTSDEENVKAKDIRTQLSLLEVNSRPGDGNGVEDTKSTAVPAAQRRKKSLESVYISRSDLQYTEGDQIGSGTFSNVYRGRFCGVEVAVKAFKDVKFLQSTKLIKSAKVKRFSCCLFVMIEVNVNR